MKRIISILLALVMIMGMCISLSACGNKQYEYRTGSWATARNDAADNLASARKKYVGEYYSFTGELTYIAEGYIAVDEVNPGKYTSGVTCTTKDKELCDIILDLKKGDMVTVKGKITDIEHDSFGNTAQMDMDVYEIIE